MSTTRSSTSPPGRPRRSSTHATTKVNTLSSAIREYVATQSGPTKVIKPNERFTFTVMIRLASWLRFEKQSAGFALTVPPDIKCDATSLRGEQLKWSAQTVTATATCSGPRGSYEARGELSFRYAVPNGAVGLGTDGQPWKSEPKP